MLYVISYDLNKPGQNYSGLFKAIKNLGSWWHYLDSTWLVDSSLTATKISDILNTKIDKNDSLLIFRLGKDKNGWLSSKAWTWINQHL